MLEIGRLHENVTLLTGDSSAVVGGLALTFDTVFPDGDHTYAGVRRDLDALADRLAPGGVLLVHDVFHPADDSGAMGVRQAVDERVAALELEFRGRFGGIALFERRAGPLAFAPRMGEGRPDG